MKQFLAIYIGSMSSQGMAEWQKLDEKTKQEREKAGMDAWMNWGRTNKAAIVVNGAPLGKTKRIDSKGISETKNLMTGYTVVQAESHEAAAKMFLNHPHFAIFPGDSVEIMECLPMPEL
jgi:hypothetical protein